MIRGHARCSMGIDDVVREKQGEEGVACRWHVLTRDTVNTHIYDVYTNLIPKFRTVSEKPVLNLVPYVVPSMGKYAQRRNKRGNPDGIRYTPTRAD